MNRPQPGRHGHRKRGVALLLVLIAVAVAATLATSFLSSQNTTVGIARNVQDYAKARYVAESGLELAIAHIRANATWRTDRPHGTWVTNEPFAGGTFTIVGEDGEDTDGDGVVDGDGDLTDDATDLVTITVTGKYGGPSYVARAVLKPDGGAAVDYDFAARTPDTDIFAYSDTNATKLPTDVVTPGGPSTVFHAQEYNDIKIDDGSFYASSGSSNNQIVRQRFEIHIDENAADVTRFDISWNGKGVNENNGKADGAEIYIWRYSGAGANAYELVVAGADTEAEVSLSGAVTANLTDYIGPAGQISLLVTSADKTSGVPNDNVLYTDYLSVAVSGGGASGGFAVRWSE